ncbi:hypothetical protein FRX31_025158 [Thalictrum thalictroides]|uniref:Uncharacterized protein n=1 Tax=Thalictrum thalictroides TaxID=46969 RepID=A0A7J6VM62_THATH|nr:hypothetical protein FRX31_025158 [Thalictrum thalictroides]
MASETVLLPHQTTPTTTVEHFEETTSPNAPITESMERTEDNKIHQPAVEKVDDSPELAVPAEDNAVVIEDNKIHQPAVEKVDDSPELAVPTEDSAVVTEDTNSKAAVSSVSELAVEGVRKETEGQTEVSDASKSAVESVEIALHSPPTQEPGAEVEVETKPEHESKVVEKLESVAEEPHLGKEPEESEYKEVENSFSIVEESEIGKNLEVAESDFKVIEKPESVVEAELEPQKHSEDDVEVTEEKHEKLEPEESIEGKLAADAGLLISKDNDATESTTKRETGEDREPFADKSSDAFVSETPSDPIDKDVSIIPDASDETPQKKDIWSDTVENFAKETSLEASKAEEEKNIRDENLAEPETTTAQDVGDAKPATDVLEKSFEGLKASGDVEIDTEEKKEETVKDDIAAPVKTVEDTEPIASKPEEGGDITSVSEAEEKKEETVKDDSAAPVKTVEDTETIASKPEEGGDITSVTEAEKSFEAIQASENVKVATEEKKEENVESDIAPVEITNDIVPQASEDKEIDYSNSAAEVAEEKVENAKYDTAAPVETIDDTEPISSKTDEGGVDTTSATEVTEKFVDELKASKDVEVTEEKIEDVKTNSSLAEITKDTVPQSSEPKEVDYPNSAAEIAEKSIEGEKASTDDVVTEEKQENVKDYTTSSVDSSKDTVLEGETNVSSTIDTSNGEPRELALEPRENDEAESKEDKIIKEAEVAETTPSSDTLNLESSKETNDSKTTEDLSKQEVPSKPVQKHSHGILSKVKHSIGKVKKAITGKSPTLKNSTSDAKGDDIKVKEGTT